MDWGICGFEDFRIWEWGIFGFTDWGILGRGNGNFEIWGFGDNGFGDLVIWGWGIREYYTLMVSIISTIPKNPGLEIGKTKIIFETIKVLNIIVM